MPLGCLSQTSWSWQRWDGECSLYRQPQEIYLQLFVKAHKPSAQTELSERQSIWTEALKFWTKNKKQPQNAHSQLAVAVFNCGQLK